MSLAVPDANETFYADADGDGFGDINSPEISCHGAPEGFVADQTDCDDADGTIYPGAEETCNYLDDNCDAEVDEDVLILFFADADYDGYGDPDINNAILECENPGDYADNGDDCDDNDGTN